TTLMRAREEVFITIIFVWANPSAPAEFRFHSLQRKSGIIVARKFEELSDSILPPFQQWRALSRSYSIPIRRRSESPHFSIEILPGMWYQWIVLATALQGMFPSLLPWMPVPRQMAYGQCGLRMLLLLNPKIWPVQASSEGGADNLPFRPRSSS